MSIKQSVIKLVLLCSMLLAASLLFACNGKGSPTVQESVLPTSQPSTFTSPLGLPIRFGGAIAFHSKRSGNLQIYVLYGDTGEIKRLTLDPAGAFEPSWSPDCSSIVFTSKRDNPDSFEIYTMNSDGSEQMRLFEHQPEDDWASAWSPDGDTIAYQTNPMGKFNVCFVSTKGEDKGCLESEYNNGSPAWSPDGNKILFTSDRDGDWEIYIADRGDDSSPVQLTHNDSTDKYPQFSPDGQYIAFSSKRTDNFDIFVMKADGSEETQLTTNSADDVSPRWVGNGRLVFASLRTIVEGSRDWDLYLMDRNGENIVQLTNTVGLDKWPAWCPVIDFQHSKTGMSR